MPGWEMLRLVKLFCPQGSHGAVKGPRNEKDTRARTTSGFMDGWRVYLDLGVGSRSLMSLHRKPRHGEGWGLRSSCVGWESTNKWAWGSAPRLEWKWSPVWLSEFSFTEERYWEYRGIPKNTFPFNIIQAYCGKLINYARYYRKEFPLCGKVTLSCFVLLWLWLFAWEAGPLSLGRPGWPRWSSLCNAGQPWTHNNPPVPQVKTNPVLLRRPQTPSSVTTLNNCSSVFMFHTDVLRRMAVPSYIAKG